MRNRSAAGAASLLAMAALIAAAPPPACAAGADDAGDVPKWQIQLSTSPARKRRQLDEELAQIVALLPGRYAGSAAATSDRPGQESSPSTVYHKIVRIEAPQFGRTVFYHQIGHDGFDGPPIQQKIYVVDESPSRDANRMKAWVIPPGRGLVNLEAKRDELHALDPATLLTFPRPCDIEWQRVAAGFEASVSSTTCEFASDTFHTSVRPDMRYVLTRESFSVQEAMHRADGSLIFAMAQPSVSRRLESAGVSPPRP